MLEIVQLSHILNNTGNAEKTHLAQQENVPLYHGLAVEREEKKRARKLRQVKKSENPDSVRINDEQMKKKRRRNKLNNRKNSGRQLPAEPINRHLIDIKI